MYADNGRATMHTPRGGRLTRILRGGEIFEKCTRVCVNVRRNRARLTRQIEAPTSPRVIYV